MGKDGTPAVKSAVASRLMALLTSEYLALAFRLYIGALFIYAGLYKINYPAEFAETIANYRIIPYWMLGFMAVVMPWIEFLCGILLILGIRAKAATVIFGAMMVMFTAAIVVALLRNDPIGCGCFHSMEDKISYKTLVRDILWLAMIAHIYLYDHAFHLENLFWSKLKKLEI